jgi:hypothetical protein
MKNNIVTTNNNITEISNPMNEGNKIKYVNYQNENFTCSIKTKPNNNNENELKNNNEDPILSYLNSNREISEEEIKSAPIIIIREESGNIFNNQTIKINAGGLIGGRNVKDGVAIFGLKKNNNNISTIDNTNNTLFTPDFYLNSDENLNYPYIFAVYFNRDKKNYHIRAYGGKDSDNRILFIKLTGKFSLPIKQKEIISAGNVIFQVTPIENNQIEITNISRKEESIEHKQIFECDINRDITIGRDKNCDFSFVKEKSFSRIQTSFSFDKKNKYWVISDGSKVKSSTNGTWVFGTHSFEIKDEMLVEILTSKIKFSISNIH